MHFTSTTASDGIAEHTFTLGDMSGVPWSPESATDGAPLLLMGHGGGLHKYAPGLVSRVRRAVAGDGSGDGFTVAAIDAPGHGDRPRADRQVDASRRSRAAGERWSLVVAERQAMRGRSASSPACLMPGWKRAAIWPSPGSFSRPPSGAAKLV
ncbi:MAG TPA: hypothetical protein VMU94_16185 [Streptosporangiaceae bacterium]|nr:hypothetical protein [Streptosporangiaceae bacterium]